MHPRRLSALDLALFRQGGLMAFCLLALLALSVVPAFAQPGYENLQATEMMNQNFGNQPYATGGMGGPGGYGAGMGGQGGMGGYGGMGGPGGMGMGGMPGMMGDMGGMGPGGAPGEPQAPLYEPPSESMTLLEARAGQRVYDAVSYRKYQRGEIALEEVVLLDDVQALQITDDGTENFHDDGETGGDYEKGDEIYSNTEPPSNMEYMGPTANYAFEKNIIMLNKGQSLHPLDFFNLDILTYERHSRVPRLRDKIIARDDRIHKVNESGEFTGWSNTFLDDYRKEPTDPESEFFPLYIPRPPAPPALPAPEGWRPFNHPQIAEASDDAAEGAAGMAGGMYQGEAGAMGPGYIGRAQGAAGMMEGGMLGAPGGMAPGGMPGMEGGYGAPGADPYGQQQNPAYPGGPGGYGMEGGF